MGTINDNAEMVKQLSNGAPLPGGRTRLEVDHTDTDTDIDILTVQKAPPKHAQVSVPQPPDSTGNETHRQ